MQSSVTEKTQLSTVTLRELSMSIPSVLAPAGSRRHLEVDVMHQNAVVVVEMAVPELRVLEGDVFDLDILRAFDEREPGAGHAGVRKVSVCGSILKEELPDGHAGAVEGAIAGELESVAVLRIDEGGVKLSMKWPSMRVRCAGKFERSVEHFRTAPSVRRRLTFGLKKRAPETKTPLGTIRVPRLGGKLIDGSLDGLGIDGGVVSDRAGLGNEELASGRGKGFRGERPERSRGEEGVEAAAE